MFLKSKSCRNLRTHFSKYKCVSIYAPIWWLSSLTLKVLPHKTAWRIWILKEYSSVLLCLVQWMHPKSLEIDKNRRTDYRCSYQVGGSEGSFSSIFWTLVFQQEWYCLDAVKTGGKGRSAWFSWKQLFRLSLRMENAAVMLERQWSHFLLLHIVVCWFCCCCS